MSSVERNGKTTNGPQVWAGSREEAVVLSQVEGMVLDAIADDFEELEEILKDVTRFGIKEGVHLEREMVVSALRHLVNSGLAFGYRLGFEPRPPIVSNIDWNDLDGLYFYVSTAGKGVIQEMSED